MMTAVQPVGLQDVEKGNEDVGIDDIIRSFRGQFSEAGAYLATLLGGSNPLLKNSTAP